MSEAKGSGVSGKLIVAVLLVVGVIAGFLMSRTMPRRNPKDAEPGTPYYSPPSEEELKALREKAKPQK